MIGQSVINVKSGGSGRLSALVAGSFLMFLILVLGKWVVQVPMAALAGVMIMVSIGTFDWASLKSLHIVPRTDAVVMVATVATVVVTHDLAKGVLAGVLLSAIFFTHKISQVKINSFVDKLNSKVTYHVSGQLFFASVSDLVDSFDYRVEAELVIIDFAEAQLWDDSAVAAVEKVVSKYTDNDIEVEIRGFNDSSLRLMKKLAGKLGSH
jgi:SulP family sulfate permease